MNNHQTKRKSGKNKKVIRRKSIDSLEVSICCNQERVARTVQDYKGMLGDSIGAASDKFASWTADFKLELSSAKIRRSDMINAVTEDPILWSLLREELINSGHVTNAGTKEILDIFLLKHKRTIANVIKYPNKKRSQEKGPRWHFGVVPAFINFFIGQEEGNQTRYHLSSYDENDKPVISWAEDIGCLNFRPNEVVEDKNDDLIVSWPEESCSSREFKTNNAVQDSGDSLLLSWISARVNIHKHRNEKLIVSWPKQHCHRKMAKVA